MNWITENAPAWNSWMALLTYWAPLAMCAYGYAARSIFDYRDELRLRDLHEKGQCKYSVYSPTLTIGVLLGRALVALCPVANLFAAIFDVAPKVFSDLFAWLGKVFDIPLVPKRDK